MPHIVTAMRVDAAPIAVVRRRAALADLSKIVRAAIGEAWTFIRSRQYSGAGRNIAVYLGGNAGLIDIECGMQAMPEFIGDSEVFLSVTPAGLAAHAEHIGNYHRLGEAHAAIRHWCACNNHGFSGPNWEIYGHRNDDPTKVTTDVFYLLDR